MSQKDPEIVLLLEDRSIHRDQAIAPNARQLFSKIDLFDPALSAFSSEALYYIKLPAGYGLNAQPWVNAKQLVNGLKDVGFLSVSDSLGFARLEALCVNTDNVNVLSGAPLPGGVVADRRIHGLSLFPLRLQEVERRDAAASLTSKKTLSAFQRGRAFDLLGDAGNALAWYRAAAVDTSLSFQENWLSRLRAAAIESNRGNTDVAIKWSQQAQDAWPERNEPLLLLSQLLRKKGDPGSAKRLLRLAKSQNIEQPDFWHIPNDYGENIHAELARCEIDLGNDANVLKHVNAYTQTAFHSKVDKQLLESRDDAYRRWIEGKRYLLPTKSSAANRFLIIVAFRNAGAYLQECIDSIAAQSYRNYKVVLVDDCSDDGAIDSLDTSRLNAVEIIKNGERRGALANQVMVLSSSFSYQDIAVFVDGDDQLAHGEVLSHLSQRYQKTGCWVTYGQSHFLKANRIGYARPILPEEDIGELFTTRPMVFPIHLRTHRVGLFHALLSQDPDLSSLRNPQGEFFEHASDVAHMRAMLMLSGTQRSLYIPDVLYKYNDDNPQSHFRTAPSGLAQDTRHIAQLPPLIPAKGFSRSRLGAGRELIGKRAADLVLVLIEGGDIEIVNSMIEKGRLPNIRRLFSNQRRLSVPTACPNDVFWRGVITGQQTGEYRAHYRTVPDINPYEATGFPGFEGLMSVQGFWEKLAYDGDRVAVLNPSEFSLAQTVPGLTSFSNWLIHAPLSPPVSSPPELVQRLNLDIPLRELLRTFDERRFVSREEIDSFVGRSRHRSAIRASAYKALLEQGDWSLFCFGMDAVHDALHNLWHFHDPTSPHFTQVNVDPVEELYESMDLELERILNSAGDTAVAMVLGLGGRPLSSLNSLLDELLLQIETNVRGDRPPKEPRMRWLFSMPSAPISGAVRFNLIGREPQGLVDPQDREALTNQICEELMGLRTGGTNQPIVKSISRPSAEARGNYANTLPDLSIHWNDIDVREGLWSDSIQLLHLTNELETVLDYRTGDHSNSAAIMYNDVFAELVDVENHLDFTKVANLMTNVLHKSSAC